MRRTFLTPGQLFIKSSTKPIHWIVESTRFTSHFDLFFFTTFARRASTNKNKRNKISALRYLYILHIEIILTLNPLNEKVI